MNPYAVQFGRNLRRRRRGAGFSQMGMAARVSIHPSAMGRIERGERVPRIDVAVKLAGALDVPITDLLEGVEWRPGDTQSRRYAPSDEGWEGSWWAALAGRLLPRTQVQIIEALRVIDRPLTAAELFSVFEEEPGWLALCRHVRRLTDLGAIELAEPPSGSNPLDTAYRLAALKVRG